MESKNKRYKREDYQSKEYRDSLILKYNYKKMNKSQGIRKS